MIQFVAFDLGGVLVDVRLEHLAKSLNRPTEETDAAFFGERRHEGFSTGSLNANAFLQSAAKMLGVSQEDASSAWASVVAPYPCANAVLAALNRPFVAWSNTDPVHVGALAPSLPPMLLGPSRALSYEVGANKPAPRFFEKALGQLQWSPDEILYLDDRLENVHAAQAFGIAAHQIHGLAECVTLLREMNVLPATFRLTVSQP